MSGGADDHRPIPGGWRDVSTLLDRSLAASLNAEALVGTRRRLSYAELEETVCKAVTVLSGLGVGRGDRVAASMVNDPEIVVAFLAVQRIGAIWVGINRALAGDEKRYLLGDSGAVLLLADARSFDELLPLASAFPDLRIVDAEPSNPSSTWRRMIEGAPPSRRHLARIDPHAPAAIAYTSGTTGFPKGVVHSQHNMMVVAARVAEQWRADGQDGALRVGAAQPLTILNLILLEVLPPLAGGGTCVCIDRADAAGIAEWVMRERIETTTVSPTTALDLVARQDIAASALASLRFATSGGSLVSDELRDGFASRFGMPLLIGYGLTEAPTSVAGMTMKSPAVPGSCGRALPHVAIAILDAEGQEVPAGEAGEIAIGAARWGAWADVWRPMLGYWGAAGGQVSPIHGGWLRTGDIGLIDADGNLFLKGRYKDVIIRGGANIYPAEVERVIKADPAVREAVVMGREDARLGETVAAFIEPRETEAPDGLIARLEAACRAQLARYKVPAMWCVVDELPRNAMNKVRKDLLRARMSELSLVSCDPASLLPKARSSQPPEHRHTHAR